MFLRCPPPLGDQVAAVPTDAEPHLGRPVVLRAVDRQEAVGGRVFCRSVTEPIRWGPKTQKLSH